MKETDINPRDGLKWAADLLTTRFYQMRLRKEWNYKLQAFTQLWVTMKDWDDLPLPDPLFFLYFLFRPFLWLRRYFAPGKKH